MHYPSGRTNDVYQHIRDVLVPHHGQLRSQGLADALFLVNPESCQGIGIAIWADAQKLHEVEQGHSRSMGRAMRDPTAAPTDYTRLRAQWVQDLGGGIVSSDWYDVVGRVGSSSTLFPSRMTGAGLTIMHYPPQRTDDVYHHITNVLVPHHGQLQSQGLADALFLVNPESCQGIGIAIWADPKKLREVEKGNTRGMARAMRDPGEAPTDYTRLRAQWVQDLGGSIVSSDWYDVVGRLPASARTSAAPEAPPVSAAPPASAAPTAPAAPPAPGGAGASSW